MSHRSPASSRPDARSLLLCAALLAACGDDGNDNGDTTTDTSAATVAATTGTSTGEPDTGPSPTTGEATGTTATDSTGASTGAGLCGDNMVTWDNFGAAFMLSWCTGCHNSALPTSDRAGAPCAINFDTYAGTLPFAPRIKDRAIDWQLHEGTTPMPPAAIVPDDELALLREWIDCGAPGPEPADAPPACPGP